MPRKGYIKDREETEANAQSAVCVGVREVWIVEGLPPLSSRFHIQTSALFVDPDLMSQVC